MERCCACELGEHQPIAGSPSLCKELRTKPTLIMHCSVAPASCAASWLAGRIGSSGKVAGVKTARTSRGQGVTSQVVRSTQAPISM